MRRDDPMADVIEALRPAPRGVQYGDDLSALLAGPEQEPEDPFLEEILRELVRSAMEEDAHKRKSGRELRGGLAASMFNNQAAERRESRQFGREQAGRRELYDLERPERETRMEHTRAQTGALNRQSDKPPPDPITEARSNDAASRGDFAGAYKLRGLPVPAGIEGDSAQAGADALEQAKPEYMERLSTLVAQTSNDPLEIRKRFDDLTGELRRRFPSVDTSRFASDLGNSLASQLGHADLPDGAGAGKGFSQRKQPFLRASPGTAATYGLGGSVVPPKYDWTR